MVYIFIVNDLLHEVMLVIEKAVTNLSVTYNVALITIARIPATIGIVSDIFNSIAKQNINVDMITQSPPIRGSLNVSFSLPASDVVKALTELNNFKKQYKDVVIEVDANNTKISVYGEKMRDLPGVAARLFTIMHENGVEIKLVTTSEVDISYLIYDKDVDKAVEAITKEFENISYKI